ncbi:MAG: hypothetical protein ACREEM_18105, partial [Blastocatellia bacterium]
LYEALIVVSASYRKMVVRKIRDAIFADNHLCGMPGLGGRNDDQSRRGEHGMATRECHFYHIHSLAFIPLPIGF